jgi:hypothetical protein
MPLGYQRVYCVHISSLQRRNISLRQARLQLKLLSFTGLTAANMEVLLPEIEILE